MNSGIYMWTSPCGKSYIGQSVNLNRRKKTFINFSKYRHGKIYKTRKKYCKESDWTYKVLEYCDVDKLDEREQYYIELYDTMNNGYNSDTGGHLNRKLSNEARQKFSGSGNPFYGKHHTEEQKRKLSEAMKGRYVGEKNPNSKAVIQLSKNGEFIAEFSTMKEASEKIGRSISSISSCCGTKDKRTIVGGFKWIKAEDYYKQMESV